MVCPLAKLTSFASPLGLHAPADVDINSWVFQGLSNPIEEGVQIFCTTLWKIWFYRNKLIFEQQPFIPLDVASSASSFVAEFCPNFLREIDVNTHVVHEASQANSLVCNRIYVDAGCFSNGSTGWGLVVKDHEGSVILSACKKEEIQTSPNLAEALGIRWAMQTAIALNYNQVTFVSDALTIVKGIEGKYCPAEVELVVQDCISLCSVFMHVDVVYVKRTLNIEAHRLVQLSKYVGCKTWSGFIPD
jgi:ribonuclease HI